MDHRASSGPAPPRFSKSLRDRSANVPVAAFRNHDQEMKNWKGGSPPPLAHSHQT
jgi:hypothetical protein